MKRGDETFQALFAELSTADEARPAARQFQGRDTGSGRFFEDTVNFILVRSGIYGIARQQSIGKRDGVEHYIDFVVTRESRRVLLEAKWQTRAGAGEKVVGYELISLSDRMGKGEYDAAYIVLGGPGWTKARKQSWLLGGYKNTLHHSYQVWVLDLDMFCQKAYEGSL